MIDAPVVSVHIPHPLRALAGGHDEVTASGDTVGEVLDAVVHEYPGMRSALLDGSGRLAPGLVVFLGGRSVRELEGLATPVGLEEVLSIVPAA